MIPHFQAGEDSHFSLACCHPHIRKYCTWAANLGQTVGSRENSFSALGMISSMAEECDDPATKLPKALSLCVPVGGLAGLFFIM